MEERGSERTWGVGVAEGHVAVRRHLNLSCQAPHSVKRSPDKDSDRGRWEKLKAVR